MDVADDEALRAYIPRRAGELKSPHELELLRRVHPQARGGAARRVGQGGWLDGSGAPGSFLIRAVVSMGRAHSGPS